MVSRVSADCYASESIDSKLADDTDPLRIMWLVEPHCTTETTRYSGTLTEVNRQTLPFMTMSAFAHFTLYWSEGQLVFVNLQGTYIFSELA
jgi:hypothetical protein